ncbi:MAG: FlgD immunoglobulin-like domain containing protein, partial [bacterium]
EWDGVEEDLSLALKGLPVGMTEIAVKARNVAGKSSNPIVKKIFFAGIKFALFDLDVREKGIYLSWNTVGETFGARLDLYRIDRKSGAPDTTVLVPDIQPKEERNLYRFFEYLDTSVEPGYRYDYFVRGYFTIEYPDTAVEYQTDSRTFSARGMFPIPTGGLASRVSPNPFNETTNISVRIPESAGGHASSYASSAPAQTEITITVYDVAGRLVKQIYRGRQFGGVHTFTWDGTNAADRRVPSGIYFIKT